MKLLLGLSVLVVLGAAPAFAQTPSGTDALKYYVGTWSCLGGPVGAPAVKATITAVMNDGLLTEHVNVPMQSGMTGALSQTYTIAYNPIAKGYNQIEIDNFGGWGVSKADAWPGHTEEWDELAKSDGRLERDETVRTDQNHYTSTGYASLTDTVPNFKAVCERTST
jgi:hypothetical protein